MLIAVESQGLRTGELLVLEGPAMPLSKISGNGRKYIPESVHTAVAELQPRIAAKALFGCLDHPDDTTDLAKLAYVKMQDVSHRIDALWYNKADDTYYIRITVLDTPNGRILKAIHDAGSPIYVSLRSLLDPARNVQRNGYYDAWMLVLVTIDAVSRPGFADAELKAVDIASTEALAVCESLNLFKHSRIFETMKKSKSPKYIPAIGLESIQGVQTEPAPEFKEKVVAFVADLLEKFPGKFTVSDFATTYPDSVFDGCVICIYEDTAEIMMRDSATPTVAMLQLDKLADGEFQLGKDATTSYFNTEVAANSDTVQGEPASEMYPIISIEDYTPSEGFMKLAQDVADYLRANYGNGFTKAQFEDEISRVLAEKFNVTASIDTTEDQQNELKFVSNDGSDAASIILTVDGDTMTPGQLSEFWQPGTEAEVGDNVKLVDASGDTIVSGEIQATGLFGDLKNTIENEDPDGYALMQNADVSDDTIVYCIAGNWYYAEDGMSIEMVEAEPGTEAEEEPTIVMGAIEAPIGSQVEVCESTIDGHPVEGPVAAEDEDKVQTDVIATGELEDCGTFGEKKDQIAEEDEEGYNKMLEMDCEDDTEVAKVDGDWYAMQPGMVVRECDAQPAKESIEATQQTEGDQPDPLPTDKHFGNGKEGDSEAITATVIDEGDKTGEGAQQAMTGQMYEIVEGDNAQVTDNADGQHQDPKPSETDTDPNDAPAALAEEAQRIFNMPNSKFSGNYAIEHMPVAYKHIWSGLSDAAKTTIAKQAQNAQIANEAQNLKFWASTNFIAVERACIAAKGEVEAALESMQVVDPRAKFLGC